MSIKKENLKYIRKSKQAFPRAPFNHKWDKHIRHEQEATLRPDEDQQFIKKIHN